MANELTVINNTPEGGKGVNLESKWFKNVKPVTVSVVQKLSKVPEDVKVGNLYIRDFNKQFKEMRCVLLHEPGEQRQYHIGDRKALNKTPDNLACFSYDLVRPHPQAKIPQSMLCANCDKGDWGPYNQYKTDNGGKTNRDLIPMCDKSLTLSMLDTELKMPLRMFIQNNQKSGFDDGMENIARLILMRKAEGLNPNIYDISFRLSTKVVQKGPYTNYVATFTDVQYLTEEEKVKFGPAFELFTKQNQAPPEPEVNTIAQESKTVDAIVDGEYVNEGGEVVI